MFNNRFNSSKNDPLVEAVKQAQAEGDLRRQAVAFVNEQFGVFSRNAVVREDLAAYDAAIEEAVKCMKEGKPNDGNLANNYPPYDKVTRGDVVAGALGKDQMGGKKKKMEEGSAVSGEDPGMEVAKKAGAAQQSQTPSSTPARTGNAAGSTISNARSAAGMNEAQLDELTGKGRLPALKSAYRDIKKTHSNEADWHAARADRAERRGESKKAEHHMDAGYGHEHKAEKAASKLKRADALQTRAKAAADIKSSKAASKSARAEYKEDFQLDEATRKHFRQHAADISKISDQGERNKAASAAADTYARLNPRFDHAKFHAAAGSTAHQDQKATMKESIVAKLFAKHMKEDQSFNAAHSRGKPVNEIAMDVPPAIQGPSVAGAKQIANKAVKSLGARFGQQGAGARPMTATPNVTRTMQSPSYMSTSKLSRPVADVSKAVNVASKAPGVVGRIASLGARMNPIAGAAATGAAASELVGKLATGTETGRAIGKSIGQTIRSVDRPVSSLPTSKPQTAADVTANKQTAAANLKASGSKFAAGKPHSVTTFAQTAPGTQAKVQSRTTEKGWNDPGAYENRAKSATGTMQQIRKGQILPQSTQTGKPDTEASTQKFLNKELGRSTPNAQGPEAPATSKAVPTPPSRPTFGSDLPKIDTGPKPGPASTPQSAAADAAAKSAASNVPTPPSRPADLGPKMQNPDQERTKVKPMSESVVNVNGNKYRIV